MEHVKLTGADRFEYATSGPDSRILTATQVLPDLNDLQTLFDDVGIDTPQWREFIDVVISDWRRGAVSSFFDRRINMGRWMTSVKNVVYDQPENRITCWINHSSKLHTEINRHLNEQRTTDSNCIIDRGAIAKYIRTTAKTTVHPEWARSVQTTGETVYRTGEGE